MKDTTEKTKTDNADARGAWVCVGKHLGPIQRTKINTDGDLGFIVKERCERCGASRTMPAPAWPDSAMENE